MSSSPWVTLLENNVFNVTNTTTYFAGRHTFTGGINFEYMTFAQRLQPHLELLGTGFSRTMIS